MNRTASEVDFERHRIELGISMERDGFTPLHRAAARGHCEIVELLIRNKCDINIQDPYGNSPLELAALFGKKNVVHLLLQCDTLIHYIDLDYYGSFLYWASVHDWVDVVQRVLERKDMSCLTDGATKWYSARQILLKYSAKLGSEGIAAFLLRTGVDVNCSSLQQRTALHYSSYFDQVKLVQILLEKDGLDLNPQDLGGKTPLHLACGKGNVEVIKKLLAAGADTSIKNNDGETAFTVGIRKKRFSPNEIGLFVQQGYFFEDCDYAQISENPDIKEHVLKDVDLCTQSIVNKFHCQTLPALYSNPNLAKELPHIKKFKLNTQEIQDIENLIKFDIKTNMFCNVVKARPIVLKLMCVQSLLTYPYRATVKARLLNRPLKPGLTLQRINLRLTLFAIGFFVLVIVKLLFRYL